MVGMLYDTEWGAAILASGHASRRVALWRTKLVSLRSEFVRDLSLFMSEISAATMSGVQENRHTRLVPDIYIFSYTPPKPMPEASQNPRWVGSPQTISTRCMG